MKTPRVELVYFSDCPNVDATREAVRAALITEGLPNKWREWNRDDPATPEALRGYGSPTVLVNGADILPTEGGNASCRVYAGGAPEVAVLRAALRQAMTGKGDHR